MYRGRAEFLPRNPRENQPRQQVTSTNLFLALPPFPATDQARFFRAVRE